MERKLRPVDLDSCRPLREVVEESLRGAILAGILEPRERLMEIQMAEEMGVSRTPVREAIRKLEQEGFVVMIPRKGAYVAGVSAKDVRDVFEIRTVLEGLAAELAAAKASAEEIEEMRRTLDSQSQPDSLGDIVQADTEFHALLYKASGNERLSVILANLREQIQRFRATSLFQPGRLEEALYEHKSIIEAVAGRDSSKARKLAEKHMEMAARWMLDTLKVKNGVSK